MKAKLVVIIASILLVTSLLTAFSLTATANFNPAPPSVFINSPLNNREYNTSYPLLNITITAFFDSGTTDREAFYSLDRKSNVSIPLIYQGTGKDGVSGYPYSIVSGTVNLPKLTNGTHSIQAFVKYYGEEFHSSRAVTFRVMTNDQEVPPNLNLQDGKTINSLTIFDIIFMLVVFLIIVIITLVIFRKKDLLRSRNLIEQHF